MEQRFTGYASEQELRELHEEVRRLRDEQEKFRDETKSSSGGSSSSQDDESKDQEQGNLDENGEGKAGKERGKEGDQAGEAQEDENKKKGEGEKRPHPFRKFIIAGVLMLLALVALLWWLHARRFENTDDAQVDGHISGLAARVAGTVAAVYVEEGQYVKAGEVITDLDPRDSEVALEQASSQYLEAQGQLRAEQPNVPLTEVTNQTEISTSNSSVGSAQAGVRAAQRNADAAAEKVNEAAANNAKAQADVERYRPLAEKDEVPRAQFDQVVANAKALAATVAANQQSQGAAQQQVEQARQQLEQAKQRAREATVNAPRQIAIRQANLAIRRASLETAQAQLNQARLNLSYCKIQSPVDGIVVKRISEVGAHVAPGQQVMLVTQTSDLWVTANFRETQIHNMHAGQSVRIHVDALNEDFDGYLESLAGASGASTSLLPPENATGNYVKVVQRLPVRIRFKQGQDGVSRLRPGMSVEPRVQVR